MAMPQRDETIEEIKRLDALLEYAVMHGDEAEAERCECRAMQKQLRAKAGMKPLMKGDSCNDRPRQFCVNNIVK